jgi:phospholipase/carboxylesterase
VSEDFAARIATLGSPLLDVMVAMEQASRLLQPGRLETLRELMAPRASKLAEALADFRETAAPEGLKELASQLAEAAGLAQGAADLFCDEPPPERAVPQLLESLRQHSLAQEALYPLHRVLPPVGRYFSEPGLHERLDELDPEPPEGVQVGIFRGKGHGPDDRGGFFLYVPESYDGREALPLVVALHGGSGQGRSFLWTWLREARSRRCLLVAPTSLGPTWSFQGQDVDAAALHRIVDHVREGWRLDPERVLLTGLSDGATYTLFCGLRSDSPFTALAPLSGVLHPTLLGSGGLEHARGRRIYQVHGSLDWMFPPALAQLARDALERAGADLVYREIADLSHTYAREENPRILDWLGAPRLH